MTDVPPDDSEPEENKKIPRLTAQEQRFARAESTDDAAVAEARLIGEGASRKDFEDDAKINEARRAEAFKDQFEILSIFALWFGGVIFACLTFVWALNLILPKCKQFLEDNQIDKLQLIITGGFVAGLASSHFKKRLGS